ncbi:MAG: protein translocase subunit SecF, partial [Candidatus Azambacteria bacterium]|nr:protein translocase subunit SecF [Candidatus Azambacteria bacterium]
IYFFGGESIKYLALMLLVGIAVGTYSSIFIASTTLTSWYDRMMSQKK